MKFECKFKNDIKLGDYYIYGRIFAVNVEIGIRFRNIQLTKGKNYDSRKRVCGLEIGVPARGCDEDGVSISGTGIYTSAIGQHFMDCASHQQGRRSAGEYRAEIRECLAGGSGA